MNRAASGICRALACVCLVLAAAQAFVGAQATSAVRADPHPGARPTDAAAASPASPTHLSPPPLTFFQSDAPSVGRIPGPAPGRPESGFEVLGRVAPGAGVSFGLALRQRNLRQLTELLHAVSDPDSPRYQRHLTKDQVDRLVGPTPASVAPLVAFLSAAGLEVEAPWRWSDCLRVRGTAAAFAAAFGTPLYRVRDRARGGLVLHKLVGRYSLPTAVAGIVDFMVGPPQWPVALAPRAAGIPTPSQDVVVPATLWNQYGTAGRAITSDAVVGVAEFTNAGISKADLQSFCRGMSVPQAGPRITCHGQCYAQGGGSDGECTLDVQMDASVFLNGTIGYYFSNAWLMAVAQMWAKGPTAAVYSISWQTGEQASGKITNTRTDIEYQKLGVMGITVVASSGDSGAVGNGNQPLNPGFPSASPYVTCVGATEFVQGSCSTAGTKLPPFCTGNGFTCCGKGTETPADQPSGGFASGGGFSVFEPVPSYQASVVKAYLGDASIPKPPASAFNASNRGYPDVAALGTNNIMYQGGWQLTGGTSASAPIVASLLGQMNDWLLNKGKKPLGFANPLLYKMAAADKSTITSVGNLQTNNKDGNQLGYTSNPNGWDPVTGLGTMHLDSILAWMSANIHIFRDA